MSSTTAEAATSQQIAMAHTEAHEGPPLWLSILVALVLGLVLFMPRFIAVWQTGAFFDSDDALRLVEVRQLLAGQSWYDMTVYRLDPPAGVFMHWSRIIDVPLAVLIKTFSVALAPELAERATRLAFPLILQALLYVGIVRLARLLIGPASAIPAIVLTLLSGMVFGQFQPGRIDHHAPQIVLIVFMIGNAIAAFDAKKTRNAVWAGVLAALSLSISIETLPFIIALAGLLALFWVIFGKDAASPLLFFGIGLALALPATFLATIGPAHWFDASCDSLSSAYLVPGFTGAIASVTLGLLARSIDRPIFRIFAACIAGACIAIAFAAIRPMCLRDPFLGLDPFVREIWLDKVSEAMPLTQFFEREPFAAASSSLPIFLGLAAAWFAAWREKALLQRRWIFFAAMCTVGALMCFFMIRVIGFAAPLALLGGAWCITRLGEALARSRWARLSAASLLMVLPFSAIGWALAFSNEMRKGAAEGPNACFDPANVEILNRLEPGLIAAPIDAGSFILAHTNHQVLAAPYHRDNHGNRLMLDAFMAEPQAAAALLRDNGVTYVALCKDLGEPSALAQHAPNSLAAALQAKQMPAFLEPISPDGTETVSLYRIFKVKP